VHFNRAGFALTALALGATLALGAALAIALADALALTVAVAVAIAVDAVAVSGVIGAESDLASGRHAAIPVASAAIQRARTASRSMTTTIHHSHLPHVRGGARSLLPQRYPMVGERGVPHTMIGELGSARCNVKTASPVSV
jgi:hypothetical protein